MPLFLEPALEARLEFLLLFEPALKARLDLPLLFEPRLEARLEFLLFFEPALEARLEFLLLFEPRLEALLDFPLFPESLLPERLWDLQKIQTYYFWLLQTDLKSLFSSHALLFPLYDLLWHISLLRHQTRALASQRSQPLRMARLVLPEAYLQDLFVQITPFAHIAKTLRFLLVEMSPNSVAYF